MRVERVYDFTPGEGCRERDPQSLEVDVPAPGSTRIAHLSDTHLGKGERAERRKEFRNWLELFVGLGAEAILHSGDLVEDPRDEAEVDWALEVLGALSVPVFGVPGNHDVQLPGEENAITRFWGPFPRAEQVGAVRVWLLDSMVGLPEQQRTDEERASFEETGFFSRGAVGAEQLAAFEELATDDGGEEFAGAQILVVHHHLRQPVPVKPFFEEQAWMMGPLQDGDELLRLARRVGVGLILHGHRHQYVPPYVPFEEVVVINGGSSTREAVPRRARLFDVADDGSALRIWELARFR